jgi:MFS family permease
MGFLARPYFFVGLFFYCVGIAFFLAHSYALVSNYVDADEQGNIMGTLLSLQAMTSVFATLVGGALMSWYVATPYVIAGGLILVSGMVFLFFTKTKNNLSIS